MPTKPIPTPAANTVPTLSPKTPVKLAAGSVGICHYHLGFLLGLNCTFRVYGTSPTNLGIYGPSPAVLDGSTARMRSPKVGLPDAPVHQCQGNYRPGDYFLVLRSGTDGPLESDVTVSIEERPWKWISVRGTDGEVDLFAPVAPDEDDLSADVHDFDPIDETA